MSFHVPVRTGIVSTLVYTVNFRFKWQQINRTFLNSSTQSYFCECVIEYGGAGPVILRYPAIDVVRSTVLVCTSQWAASSVALQLWEESDCRLCYRVLCLAGHYTVRFNVCSQAVLIWLLLARKSLLFRCPQTSSLLPSKFLFPLGSLKFVPVYKI